MTWTMVIDECMIFLEKDISSAGLYVKQKKDWFSKS